MVGISVGSLRGPVAQVTKHTQQFSSMSRTGQAGSDQVRRTSTQTVHSTAEIDSRKAVVGWCRRGRHTTAAICQTDASGEFTRGAVP